MPIAKVHRISASAPDDVSGIEAAIKSGQIDPAGVFAVLGKTEGNGLVNDFSRGLATTSLGLFFRRYLPEETPTVSVWSCPAAPKAAWRRIGSCLSGQKVRAGASPALAIGRAHTSALPFELLGRLVRSIQWPRACAAPMADAGIAMPSTTSISSRSSVRS